MDRGKNYLRKPAVGVGERTMQIPEQPPGGGMSSADQSLRTLLRDVDEFLKYIAIVKTPEVDAVRANLERSLGMAKRQLQKAVLRVQRKASGGVPARSLGEHPWAAIAAAVLLGAWFGKVLHTLTGTRRHSVR
jgi:ElaB/YqjD/DUF883 family membrane-anchored ribosome-binding protein